MSGYASTCFAGGGPRYGRGQRYVYLVADGATGVSGPDAAGLTLNYSAGNELVYLNGRLLPRVDYVATTGSAIAGLPPLSAGDVVEVLSLNVLI